MRLRDDYIRDASAGLRRWNKPIQRTGVAFEPTLPDQTFNRKIGVFSAVHCTPKGEIVSKEAAAVKDWLSAKAGGDFIQSLMKPCFEPGKYASWIAPPKVGIDNKPGISSMSNSTWHDPVARRVISGGVALDRSFAEMCLGCAGCKGTCCQMEEMSMLPDTVLRDGSRGRQKRI